MVNEQRHLHLSFALGFYRDAVCHSWYLDWRIPCTSYLWSSLLGILIVILYRYILRSPWNRISIVLTSASCNIWYPLSHSSTSCTNQPFSTPANPSPSTSSPSLRPVMPTSILDFVDPWEEFDHQDILHLRAQFCRRDHRRPFKATNIRPSIFSKSIYSNYISISLSQTPRSRCVAKRTKDMPPQGFSRNLTCKGGIERFDLAGRRPVRNQSTTTINLNIQTTSPKPVIYDWLFIDLGQASISKNIPTSPSPATSTPQEFSRNLTCKSGIERFLFRGLVMY